MTYPDDGGSGVADQLGQVGEDATVQHGLRLIVTASHNITQRSQRR